MTVDTDHLNPNVSFELYKIFYYAANERNYSKAASHLHVTQSAISQAIKSLETQLDIHLFFKQGRNIQLTHEGELLYQHIEKAFHFIKSAESALESIKSLDEGTIFIGASDTLTHFYLIDTVKIFHQLYPKVKISIYNRPSPQSIERLRKGEIDFAVVNLNPEIKYDDLSIHALCHVDNVFICSPELCSEFSATESLTSLSKHSLICLEKNSTTRKILEHFYDQHDVPLIPSFEFGSVEIIIEAVKANMGIGFVPKNAIESDLVHGTVKKILISECIPDTEIGVITSKSRPMSLASQKFLNLLVDSL